MGRCSQDTARAGHHRYPAPLAAVWVMPLGACVGLRAQDAEQAVLLVVEARGKPQRVGATVGHRAGQQAPQAWLSERLPVEVRNGGDPVREVMALTRQNVDPTVTEVTDQQRAGRVTPACRAIARPHGALSAPPEAIRAIRRPSGL